MALCEEIVHYTILKTLEISPNEERLDSGTKRDLAQIGLHCLTAGKAQKRGPWFSEGYMLIRMSVRQLIFGSNVSKKKII